MPRKAFSSRWGRTSPSRQAYKRRAIEIRVSGSDQMQANQLRLYFSAFAYVMVHTLRRVGLAGTKLARAQSWTLRVRLLKIGAQVRITSRKVWLSFSESYPYAALLRTALTQVQALPLRC